MPRAAAAHAKASHAAIPVASGHRIAPSPQPVAVRCQRRGVKPVTCAKTRTVRLLLVGAPDYFERHGHPAHPRDLARHRALRYTHARVGDAWRFHHRVHGDFSQVVPAAPDRVPGRPFRPGAVGRGRDTGHGHGHGNGNGNGNALSVPTRAPEAARP
jgi:hypothetical protein